jgi:hypothetical protein
MGRRSPESMLKRAREQALREKRESKQAKKDARALARRVEDDDPTGAVEVEVEADGDEEPATG